METSTADRHCNGQRCLNSLVPRDRLSPVRTRATAVDRADEDPTARARAASSGEPGRPRLATASSASYRSVARHRRAPTPLFAVGALGIAFLRARAKGGTFCRGCDAERNPAIN